MKFTLCLSFLLIGLQVHCHHIRGYEEHRNSREVKKPKLKNEKKIKNIIDDFALRSYKFIASNKTSQNVFFSPLSISTALAMLAMGAKGETHRQLFSGLGFNLADTKENEIHEVFKLIVHTLSQPSNVTEMNIGNALFVDKSVKFQPTYRNDIKTLYKAQGLPTNFKNSAAAKKKINNYVKKRTHGKITQAVENLDAATIMVLVNYIFFKAPWKHPFNPDRTKETHFFVDAKTTVKVNMMYREGKYDLLYDEDLSCWVVRVPYEGDNSAWFILPDQGKLKSVEDALTTQLFTKWSNSVQNGDIKLYIPKFTIPGSLDLKELMQHLGVKDVFTNKADLSGIAENGKLKVSKAVHEAVLDVHEAGTEAAAITVLEAAFLSAVLTPQPTIKLDRPFLTCIVNNHINNIVFLGKVMNPTIK